MPVRLLLCIVGLIFSAPVVAHAVPMTVNGDPFTLVATSSSATQLYELTSDAQGRVYAGNNSNNTTGIPVQLFDPSLFTGSSIVLQDFGPAVGDADGITYGNGFLYVADRDDGVRKIAVPAATDSLYLPGVAINGSGSPLLFRPSDGHLFVGAGGLTGLLRIVEYDETGTFVRNHATGSEVQTMAYDPASGLIYYAPYSTNVRVLNPVTDVDKAVGTASGFIDGGLAFDSRTGLIFVGTANGPNPGLVETIDPATGTTTPFASGFNGALGILREPVSGDLYFLEADKLYRLPSSAVSATLDRFLCYKTKDSRGNICSEEALQSVGAACTDEEDCGGQSDGDEETAFCVPKGFPKNLRVALSDQFEEGLFDVQKPAGLCNPAEVEDSDLSDLDTHLEAYQIRLTKGQCAAGAPQNANLGCKREEECGGTTGETRFCVKQPKHQPQKNLMVENQFHPSLSVLRVDTVKPNRLLVPTAKSLTEPVVAPNLNDHEVDHFTCYRTKISRKAPKFPKGIQVSIMDQFNQPKVYDVQRPTRLCVAAEKMRLPGGAPEAIKHPENQLMCYQVKAIKKPKQPKHVKVKGIFLHNQFAPERVDTIKEEELCVPSTTVLP